MPIPPTQNSSSTTRKAVYSVTEVATRLCSMSRARFYDLVKDGVMPYPVYCVRTKRPMYPADLAALCVRVKETNIGVDGRFVIFYAPRTDQSAAMNSRSRPQARREQAQDPLRSEMIEALRAMGIDAAESEMSAVISEKCPLGVKEATFESDLRGVFDRLRGRNGV